MREENEILDARRRQMEAQEGWISRKQGEVEGGVPEHLTPNNARM